MKVYRIASLALAAAVAAVPAAGEDPKPAAPAAKAEKKAPAMPSQEEMMKLWQEVATPGKPHQEMAKLAGTWTAKTKAWMEPGKPPEETEGTSEMKMVLGGRFLEQRHKGTMMGQPFEGLGYTGYDNYKKKYVATWMDSSGTMILFMTGTTDKSGKVMTMTGQMDDFVLRKSVTVKAISTTVDDDHTTFELWGPGPDGKPFKMMEMAYTRKK